MCIRDRNRTDATNKKRNVIGAIIAPKELINSFLFRNTKLPAKAKEIKNKVEEKSGLGKLLFPRVQKAKELKWITNAASKKL